MKHKSYRCVCLHRPPYQFHSHSKVSTGSEHWEVKKLVLSPVRCSFCFYQRTSCSDIVVSYDTDYWGEL